MRNRGSKILGRDTFPHIGPNMAHPYGHVYAHTGIALCWLIRPVDPQKYLVYPGPPPTDFVRGMSNVANFVKVSVSGGPYEGRVHPVVDM